MDIGQHNLLTMLRRRLSSSRGDLLGREQGQAFLRVAVIAALVIYLSFALGHVLEWPPHFLLFCLSGFVYAVVMYVHTLRATEYSPWRRHFNNFIDIATISYFMYQTGDVGAPLFALYVWVSIGNGFRFGNRALGVSTAMSVLGFGTIIVVSELWQQHLTFAGGALFTIVVLPLYAAHLIRMLNSALQRAEEASAAKGRFLARMSHELRTPLNGRSLLQVIRDSVQVSLRQINNVLDFSKIEAGKLIIERTDLDLHDVVNSVAGMVRPSAVQKGLRLLVRIAPNAPYRLVGDPHHLREVLLNLMANAVRFTDQGFVCLEVSGGRDATAGKALIRFEVRDTGIGIAANALDRIFESFTQEDTSTTRRHGGTGLGTTIAKQLVEQMGGRIGVQSVKGQGSVFWLEIPFDRQQRAGDQTEPLLGMRAVLLSENGAIAKHFNEFFRNLSGQLHCLPSGEAVLDAMARALRLGNTVHAVFVDGALAIGADGKHRYDELCEKVSAAGVPLYLLTDSRPFAEQLREWGYGAVLSPRADEALVHTALHASPARLAANDGRVVSVAPWLWGRTEGKRPRVLVADDNRTNLMIVRRMLEQAGYDVQLAESGDEALERLYGGGFRLAILDMHMPGLDGTSVVRQYRNMRPRSRLPIIVLTANVTFDAQQEVAESGADAYLSKPVTAADLLAEVERLVNDSEVATISGDRPPPTQAAVDREVLDVGVLAELDRLYGDPREMGQIISEYEREGRELLAKISRACETRNHPGFCDAVHALKGNAANVGGLRLMETCQHAEAGGLVVFLRERAILLKQMQDAFSETVTALRTLVNATDAHETDNADQGRKP